jgi:hypothetical protein
VELPRQRLCATSCDDFWPYGRWSDVFTSSFLRENEQGCQAPPWFRTHPYTSKYRSGLSLRSDNRQVCPCLIATEPVSLTFTLPGATRAQSVCR